MCVCTGGVVHTFIKSFDTVSQCRFIVVHFVANLLYGYATIPLLIVNLLTFATHTLVSIATYVHS